LFTLLASVYVLRIFLALLQDLASLAQVMLCMFSAMAQHIRTLATAMRISVWGTWVPFYATCFCAFKAFP
jgi:hypothetical protein